MVKGNCKMSLISLSSDEIQVPELKEVKIKHKNYVGYGLDNVYPNFLLDLYDNCSEHQSIIDSTVNYVLGSELIISDKKLKNLKEINKDGQILNDVFRLCEWDYQIFGGYTYKVILNRFKEITEVIPIPFNFIRVNEDITKAYYCKEFGKWGAEAIEYEIFDPKNPKTNTIVYYNGKKTRNIYPIPLYNAAIKAILTSIKINDFHLNNVNTNFLASGIINFNNGVPPVEIQEQIERKLKDKFTGTEAQKLLISFNDTKENSVTIDRLDSDDYDKKYEALFKTVQNQIFISHKITSPSLFGILAENQGFSKTEFIEAFQIYNKTVIEPLQKDLCREFEKILGLTYPNLKLSIKPFQIENNNIKPILNS
jgi:hypothetical protein